MKYLIIPSIAILTICAYAAQTGNSTRSPYKQITWNSRNTGFPHNDTTVIPADKPPSADSVTVQTGDSATVVSSKIVLYARVRVSPEGIGTFIRLVKNPPADAERYEEFIKEHLKKVHFNEDDHVSTVVMRFVFNQK